MRQFILFSIALIAVSSTQVVWGHGIPLKISIDGDNQLFSQSLVSYDIDESQFALSSGVVKGAAGFYPAFGVFPTGKALTVDAAGSFDHPTALLFWNGSAVTASPVSATLSRTGISVTVNPTDTFLNVGTLSNYNGTATGHSALTVSLPVDAPTGLYGFGFQVTSPGYTRSETFWAVGNYGVTDPNAVAEGLAAIHAVVPEPSSLALCAIGLIGFGAIASKRLVRD